jgi:hypothetical protein
VRRLTTEPPSQRRDPRQDRERPCHYLFPRYRSTGVSLGFNGTDTGQSPAPAAFFVNGKVCSNV